MSHHDLEFAATDIAISYLTIACSNRQFDHWCRQDKQRDSAYKRAICDVVWCTIITLESVDSSQLLLKYYLTFVLLLFTYWSQLSVC